MLIILNINNSIIKFNFRFILFIWPIYFNFSLFIILYNIMLNNMYTINDVNVKILFKFIIIINQYIFIIDIKINIFIMLFV